MTQTPVITPIVQPSWGNKNRPQKAHALLTTLRQFSTFDVIDASWLDIGCGSGGIAAEIAAHVREITGIDPEPWSDWKVLLDKYSNLDFIRGSYDTTPVPVSSADVIVCNQVYEHVPDPVKLIRFIYNTLRPGGLAYFAGPNLLFPIEPHTFWPFVHWLPRSTAVSLMRMLGSEMVLDANSTTYWQLRRWLADFEVFNAVPYILRHPADYNRSRFFWRMLAIAPERLLDILTFASPAFVFVLRKP